MDLVTDHSPHDASAPAPGPDHDLEGQSVAMLLRQYAVDAISASRAVDAQREAMDGDDEPRREDRERAEAFHRQRMDAIQDEIERRISS